MFSTVVDVGLFDTTGGYDELHTAEGDVLRDQTADKDGVPPVRPADCHGRPFGRMPCPVWISFPTAVS